MKNFLIGAFLITLGCLQMTGDLLGLDNLKGVAAATGASPAPKVFTAHEGFETFSAQFYIDYVDHNGASQTLALTPDVYRGLRGPYNRRNAYGAVLAYGPLLAANPRTAGLFNAVSQYGFCEPAPLRRELAIDASGPLTVRIEPRNPSGNNDRQLAFEVQCDE